MVNWRNYEEDYPDSSVLGVLAANSFVGAVVSAERSRRDLSRVAHHRAGCRRQQEVLVPIWRHTHEDRGRGRRRTSRSARLSAPWRAFERHTRRYYRSRGNQLPELLLSAETAGGGWIQDR